MLVVNPDRQSLSRYGLNPDDVQRTVSTAVGGTVAGEFIEGDRRTDIVVVCRTVAAEPGMAEGSADPAWPARQ